MRLHRFYVSQPLGEVVVLEDVSLLKQWIKVFRYESGIFVILFNGNGKEYKYLLEAISNTKSTLALEETYDSFIPSKKITLYLSLIKKDNFELVVQKATELGVTKIVPIISSRSEKKNLNEERLHKISTEASEQCGRGDILTISKIISLKEALNELKDPTTAYILQMNSNPLFEEIRKKENLSFFIGPEGGWSPEEEKLFTEHKIESISLGKTILRAETAAIAVSSLFSL